MKVPSWLYLILVTAGVAGLTLLLSFSFLFFYVLLGFGNLGSDSFLGSSFFLVLLLISPLFISLSIAYVFLSRRFHSPTQRRLFTSILVTFTGIIMFLVVITVGFSGSGLFTLLTFLISFAVMSLGFSLALPFTTTSGVPPNDSTRTDNLNPIIGESGSYLPAAGVATLIATILTGLVSFFSLPIAMGYCSINCTSLTSNILGILSIFGVIAGIAASSSLLKARYRRTVPLGLIFLAISPLIILFAWVYWAFLALPILALCIASGALTGWDQRASIKASDWKAVGILTSSLGAIALVAGALQYSRDAWNNTCLGVIVRPYFNNAGFLLSLGASGIIFALISADSARVSRAKPHGFLPSKPRKHERSALFHALIILFTISLATTTVFGGALLVPSLNQCHGFCYTQVEQLEISQATFGPSTNQVTFTLGNSGTLEIIIAEVQVQSPVIASTSTIPLSSPLICPGSSRVLLVATFQGVTFVRGSTYSFALISSNGNKFPYSATL